VFEIESLIENGAEKLCTQSVGEGLEFLFKVTRVPMYLNSLPIQFTHHIIRLIHWL